MCACGKDMLHCNTAVTHGQHVACSRNVMIYPFFLGKEEKVIKDGLTEFAILANLRLAVGPASCTFALLAEFLPAMPLLKTSVIRVPARIHREFCHAGHYKIHFIA